MNRRQFNAAAVASLWLPSLIVPRQKVKHIDLSKFCDDDPWIKRYDLTTPFQQEGLTYACDYRACVRTPLPVVMGDEPKESRRPKAAGLDWWDHDENSGWQSWDNGRLVEYDTEQRCPRCESRGRLGDIQKHHPCDGSGYVTIGDEYEKWCECRTGWVGGSECPRCRGEGYIEFAVEMGGLLISPIYHARIAALGNVDYFVGHPEEPLRFRAESIDGLLMGLRRE